MQGDHDSPDPLIAAIRKGNTLEATNVTRDTNGAHLCTMDARGHSPLHIAAEVGNIQLLQLFLSYKVDINVNKEGFTPLHSACLHGQESSVKALIQHGADVNAKMPFKCKYRVDGDTMDVGSTALSIAAARGFVPIVKRLLRKGAHVNSVSPVAETPLNVATKHGQIQSVTALLDHGADIQRRDEQGFTALHVAAYENHSHIVKLLLKRGADIDAKDHVQKATPLQIAIRFQNFDSFRALLDAGANLNVYTTGGHSIHEIAAIYGGPEMIVTLREKAGAPSSTRLNMGVWMQRHVKKNIVVRVMWWTVRLVLALMMFVLVALVNYYQVAIGFALAVGAYWWYSRAPPVAGDSPSGPSEQHMWDIIQAAQPSAQTHRTVPAPTPDIVPPRNAFEAIPILAERVPRVEQTDSFDISLADILLALVLVSVSAIALRICFAYKDAVSSAAKKRLKARRAVRPKPALQPQPAPSLQSLATNKNKKKKKPQPAPPPLNHHPSSDVPLDAPHDPPSTLAHDHPAAQASLPTSDTHTNHHDDLLSKNLQDDQCVICFDAPRDTVFLPCRHLSSCLACAQLLQKSSGHCPMCRGGISDVMTVYL
eukprot:TRINITY_DN10290_c0_g1_i1.p1 TRINITY_DN10290_c0_g1~~TRINITY_DN10290_c0_g1_i1.p1  ORF type:complete len:595 (+),score=110.66 TRINITY_DN10290_c0_g1_i1:11-1795(+)